MSNIIYTIYKHTSKTTGSGYVGVTNQGMQTRFTGHKRNARNGCEYIFHRAIRKYTPEDFISEELFFTTEEEFAYELEQYFIDIHNTHKSKGGYNISWGGKGPRLFGEDNGMWNYEYSEEQIEHFRKINSGENNPMSGKSRTQEFKDMIGEVFREAAKNRPPISDETRQKLCDKAKGRKYKIVTCPHCGKSGGSSAMGRWHFDRCPTISDR